MTIEYSRVETIDNIKLEQMLQDIKLPRSFSKMVDRLKVLKQENSCIFFSKLKERINYSLGDESIIKRFKDSFKGVDKSRGNNTDYRVFNGAFILSLFKEGIRRRVLDYIDVRLGIRKSVVVNYLKLFNRTVEPSSGIVDSFNITSAKASIINENYTQYHNIINNGDYGELVDYISYMKSSGDNANAHLYSSFSYRLPLSSVCDKDSFDKYNQIATSIAEIIERFQRIDHIEHYVSSLLAFIPRDLVYMAYSKLCQNDKRGFIDHLESVLNVIYDSSPNDIVFMYSYENNYTYDGILPSKFPLGSDPLSEKLIMLKYRLFSKIYRYEDVEDALGAIMSFYDCNIGVTNHEKLMTAINTIEIDRELINNICDSTIIHGFNPIGLAKLPVNTLKLICARMKLSGAVERLVQVSDKRVDIENSCGIPKDKQSLLKLVKLTREDKINLYSGLVAEFVKSNSYNDIITSLTRANIYNKIYEMSDDQVYSKERAKKIMTAILYLSKYTDSVITIKNKIYKINRVNKFKFSIKREIKGVEIEPLISELPDNLKFLEDNISNELTFGIEFEFITDKDGADICDELNYAECPVLDFHERYGHSSATEWVLCYDSSVEGKSMAHGYELTTRALKGKEGVREVLRYLRALKKIACPSVNETCGTHIHIGTFSDDDSRHKVEEFRAFYRKNEDSIDELMPYSRRSSNNHFCATIEGKDRDEKYQKVTLSKLWNSTGTFEIRHHSGTLNFLKIMSWVVINQNIMDGILTGEIDYEERTDSIWDYLKLANLHIEPIVDYVKYRIKCFKKQNRDSRASEIIDGIGNDYETVPEKLLWYDKGGDDKNEPTKQEEMVVDEDSMFNGLVPPVFATIHSNIGLNLVNTTTEDGYIVSDEEDDEENIW